MVSLNNFGCWGMNVILSVIDESDIFLIFWYLGQNERTVEMNSHNVFLSININKIKGHASNLKY